MAPFRYLLGRYAPTLALVAGGALIVGATLAAIEERWEPFGFVRIHRQYVANLGQVLELRPQLGGTAELAFEDGQTVPIARRHVAELRRRLGV